MMPPDASVNGEPKLMVRYPDEASWLAARREGIFSSDGPDILNRGFRGALSVYADKVSDAPRPEPTWIMRRGKAMEQTLAEEFSRQTGLQQYDPGDYSLYRSGVEPWMGCTPDRFVEENAILEIKTVNYFQRHKWGDEPSEYALIQAQHAIFVLNKDGWHIIAEIGPSDPVCYRGERNERFLVAYVETLREFHQRVINREPPAEVDGSEASREALARLYPKDNGLTISLPESFVAVDERRQSLAARIKAMTDEKDEIDNRLRAEIGEASVCVLPNGVEYTLRQQDRHNKASKASVSTFRKLKRKGK
jgi:predicted phage-related endonuclease